MAFNLKGRSFLTLKDYSAEEISYLLKMSKKVKEDSRAGVVHQRFKGKTLGMVFEKRSTRTRCAFETAFGEEGGYAVFLANGDIQLGVKESLMDTARVLGRMFDGIAFRGFKQETVEELEKYSGVPVINGLTTLCHPTQILADFMTIEEEFGTLKDIHLTYVGDGRNNMSNSLMIGCAKMGLHYTILSPKHLWPEDELVEEAKSLCEVSRGSITITDDIKIGVKDADVIYTDVWASMGEEEKEEERIKILNPYQVNKNLMEATGKKETIFMHCLPAVKGQEVTFDIIEGSSSRVWEESENRKHTIKSIMLSSMV